MGVGLAVAGLVATGRTGFAVFGAVVLGLTILWRAWMTSCWWIGVRLRSADGHVLVHRASAAFDADARRLFLAASSRR